jgi:hypothetical protein
VKWLTVAWEEVCGILTRIFIHPEISLPMGISVAENHFSQTACQALSSISTVNTESILNKWRVEHPACYNKLLHISRPVI